MLKFINNFTKIKNKISKRSIKTSTFILLYINTNKLQKFNIKFNIKSKLI